MLPGACSGNGEAPPSQAGFGTAECSPFQPEQARVIGRGRVGEHPLCLACDVVGRRHLGDLEGQSSNQKSSNQSGGTVFESICRLLRGSGRRRYSIAVKRFYTNLRRLLQKMVALPVPALEVRSPEWRRRCRRALSKNEPATPRSLQLTCSRVAGWWRQTARSPSRRSSGVRVQRARRPPPARGDARVHHERRREEWKARRRAALGELCGMLEHDLSPHVNRRILALLRGGLGCGIPHEASPRSSGENAVPLGDAVASLPQLSLSAGRQATLGRRCGSWGSRASQAACHCPTWSF